MGLLRGCGTRPRWLAVASWLVGVGARFRTQPFGPVERLSRELGLTGLLIRAAEPVPRIHHLWFDGGGALQGADRLAGMPLPEQGRSRDRTRRWPTAARASAPG